MKVDELIPLIIGLILIGFGTLSIVRNWELAKQLQKIEFLGVRLEITVSSMLILLGTTCALLNLGIAYTNSRELHASELLEIKAQNDKLKIEISSTETSINLLKKELQMLNKPDIIATINIIGSPSFIKNLDPNNFHIKYVTNEGEGGPMEVLARGGFDKTSLQFTINNVTKNTIVKSVVLIDQTTKREYPYTEWFSPTEPKFPIAIN